MNRSRIRVYCFFAVTLPLGILGCGGNVAYLHKGPEVATSTITINNCLASPDTAQVKKGQTLTWTVDSTDAHTYSINFPKNKPIASATVPTGQGQPVTGDFACKYFGWINANSCVYSYNLIQVGVQTCKDPGIHMVN
jgi:hypothetical protein